MADQARKDFMEVALTLEGRVARLPQAERGAIEEIERNREQQKTQLAQEQAQRRQADIVAERTRITGAYAAPALRPRGLGASESFQRFSARMEKQAAHTVDARHAQEIARVEDEKKKDIERQVEQAERRAAERDAQSKRAAELAQAAQRAREMQDRGRDGQDRGR